MVKKELCKQYADKKTMDCHNSRFSLSNHDLHVKKSYDLFTGYDIEQAFEDGFDKAVELAVGFLHKVACGYAIRELLTGEPYEGKIIGDFKKYLEENV